MLQRSTAAPACQDTKLCTDILTWEAGHQHAHELGDLQAGSGVSHTSCWHTGLMRAAACLEHVRHARGVQQLVLQTSRT